MDTTSIFGFAITVFTGFFAIMNPITNTPVFTGMTAGATYKEKKEVAKKAVLTTFAIIASFVLLGKYIFEVFHLTIPAFKIAGGILVFFVGFEMLQSKKSSIHDQNAPDFNEDVAISPLAIPILAGPGTIVTAMNYVEGVSYLYMGVVLLMFLLICVLTYVAFVFSDKLVGFIGANKIVVLGKLMGLILTVIGVSMVVEGIGLAFSLNE